MGFQLFLEVLVDGVVRMGVGRVFQEYGTDIAHAQVSVKCKLCLGGS